MPRERDQDDDEGEEGGDGDKRVRWVKHGGTTGEATHGGRERRERERRRRRGDLNVMSEDMAYFNEKPGRTCIAGLSVFSTNERLFSDRGRPKHQSTGFHLLP